MGAPLAGDESPRCILVVGMHRSGTSGVTRTLHLMGAAAPGDLIEPALDNPDGFWEPMDIVAANERFLVAMGSTWDDPRPVHPSAFRTTAAAACRAELLALLRRDFSGIPLFIIKDPRLCKLLPIWTDVLEEFGARPLFVLPIRNPVEVALSLGKRDKMPREQAFALWLIHAVWAEKDTRGLSRTFTSYDRFVTEPVQAARELCDRLDCFSPDEMASGLVKIEAQWSQGLRNHAVMDEATIEDPTTPTWIRETYQWMVLATKGAEPPTAPLDDIARAVTRSLEIYGPFLAAQFVPPPPPGTLTRLNRSIRRRFNRALHRMTRPLSQRGGR